MQVEQKQCLVPNHQINKGYHDVLDVCGPLWAHILGAEEALNSLGLSEVSVLIKIAAAAARCAVFRNGSSASMSLSQSFVSEEQKDLPVFVFQFALTVALSAFCRVMVF